MADEEVKQEELPEPEMEDTGVKEPGDKKPYYNRFNEHHPYFHSHGIRGKVLPPGTKPVREREMIEMLTEQNEKLMGRLEEIEKSVATPQRPAEAILLDRILELEKKLVTKESEADAIKKADAALKAQQRRFSKRKPHAVGEVCHSHDYENREYEIEKRPCLAVEYRVRNRQGLMINDELLIGRVIVPQCQADYLNMMDQEAQINEVAMYTDKGRVLDLGQVN